MHTVFHSFPLEPDERKKKAKRKKSDKNRKDQASSTQAIKQSKVKWKSVLEWPSFFPLVHVVFSSRDKFVTTDQRTRYFCLRFFFFRLLLLLFLLLFFFSLFFFTAAAAAGASCNSELLLSPCTSLLPPSILPTGPARLITSYQLIHPKRIRVNNCRRYFLLFLLLLLLLRWNSLKVESCRHSSHFTWRSNSPLKSLDKIRTRKSTYIG